MTERVQGIEGCIVWIFAVLLIVIANSARADTVFHWQGNCILGCTGSASADLTLANGATPFNFDPNYFPNHDVSDFFSFSYTSSSGSFFMDNTSPYLYAQGLGNGLLLEENGQGPNTLPLFQWSTTDNGAHWQFLFGSYFWQCLDAQCTTWTDDVIRNVTDGGFVQSQVAAVPEPSTWAMMLIGFAGLGFMGLRQRKRMFAAS